MPVLDTFSLRGKVALITGGAGLYGRQLVAALAEGGATTYVAARTLEPLEELAAAHREQGYDVTALRLDQAEEDSVLQVRDEILSRAGKIDVLVNNAVVRPMKQGYEDDASTFAESMRVNATGLFILTRAIGDAMSDGGSIINIGSIYGMVGPNPVNYAGTDMHSWSPDYYYNKGGMENYTRFLASYYGRRGIRCNCISAGGLTHPDHPEPFIRQYSAQTCLGRLADQSALQGILVFLASDASEYLTGANIPVDGGYTAK